MKALDSGRWRRISPHLDRALALEPRDREAWLVSLRTDDPALADDVEALLEEHRALTAEGFLAGGRGAIRTKT